jgi:adenylate cyclase
MKSRAADPTFERALSAEILASEQIRIRALAAILGVLLIVDQLLFLLDRDALRQLLREPVPTWLPLRVIGPFLAYEIVVLLCCGTGSRAEGISRARPASPMS